MKNIGILGCGKLGLYVASHLLEKEFKIKGTTTKSENIPALSNASIEGFVYEIGTDLSADFFEDLDVLILSIPISESKEIIEFQPLVDLLKQYLENSTKLIFTSSIGVYQSNQSIINEITGKCKPNSINFQLENILTELFKERLTILRLGGLISNERHPIFSLAGRKLESNGNAPVNLIHHSDVARMIESIIQQDRFGKIYNCVFPSHPSKQNYYASKALENNLTPPVFEVLNDQEKTVDGGFATLDLGFEYTFEI